MRYILGVLAKLMFYKVCGLEKDLRPHPKVLYSFS